MINKFVFIAITVIGIFGCKSSQKTESSTKEINQSTTVSSAHNSQNSLDWNGTYSGTLPCADCQGIQTAITLKNDLTYIIKRRYIGKSDSIYQSTGKFEWSSSGNEITLIPSSGNQSVKALVGENTLTQLSMFNEIISDTSAYSYILSKYCYNILEKYWKLTELNGTPIKVDSTYSKEPHIIIKEKDCRMSGNAGCNNISATALLQGANRISFSQAISTKMACINIQHEQQFIEVLQQTKRFHILADELTFFNEEMHPIAKFKTVYMK
jgi:heat shock protein HslJ